MNRLVALILAAASPFVGVAAACARDHRPTPNVEAAPLDADHAIFGRVLARVVKPDGVDYAALVDDRADLETYRVQLAKAPLPTARAARMAHLINVYNVFTLVFVIDFFSVDCSRWASWSIKDGGGAVVSVWKRYSFDLGGQKVTLDEIEHAFLRKMGDPRIHFAINCASKSCPALWKRPFRATSLESDLATVTQAFFADPMQFRVSGDNVYLNPILDWFAADFVNGVKDFLLANLPEGRARTSLATSTKLTFFDYDWRLNLAKATR